MKHVSMLLLAMSFVGCSEDNNAGMNTKTQTTVGTIEMVVFKTKPGYSKAQVIAAAKAVNPIAAQFDGYLGRKLAIDENGTWTDLVYWSDLESAKHAAQEVLKSETCQYFFSMIEEETMQFSHLEQVMSDRRE